MYFKYRPITFYFTNIQTVQHIHTAIVFKATLRNNICNLKMNNIK